MRVEHLSLRDYRNIESTDLSPAGDLVVLVGDNGQGKTNVLEALYYLANLKSFRGARRRELIAFGHEGARLGARVRAVGSTRTFEVRLTRDRRKMTVDGKDRRSLSRYFEGIRAVAFTPEDPAMVRGSPAGRRGFMDRGSFLRRPDHLDLVRELTRIVQQKNALLRQVEQPLGEPQLQAWNQRMAEVGAAITARRAEFVDELQEHLQRAHEAIAPSADALEVSYRCCCDSPGDADELLAGLERVEDGEWRQGRTLFGPHREDLRLRLGGRNLRTYGSQGQVRTAALALKLALLASTSSAVGDPPLFLLDDLGSELDPGRNERLLGHLLAGGSQVFVATTTLRHVPVPEGDCEVYEVADGVVSAR